MLPSRVLGIFVACALFMCQHISVYGLAYTPTDILWNRCPTDDLIYAKLHNHTLDTCAIQCRDHVDCWAAMYNRISAVCFLVRNDASTPFALHKCQGYVLVEKSRMQTGSPNEDYAGLQICDEDALIQSHEDCSIRGNVHTPGGKIRLGCTIPIYHCEDSIFVCGQDGLWTFEKCLQKMKNFTLVSEFPTGSFTNFALNASVSMSSKYIEESPGTLLVDGDRNSTWPCASTTQNDTHPSMAVDFGQLRTVSHMFIVNRMDCCEERLHNVRILIGPDLDNLWEAIYIPGLFGKIGVIKFAEPVTIRYVKITIPGGHKLTICEFEAWLEEKPSPR